MEGAAGCHAFAALFDRCYLQDVQGRESMRARRMSPSAMDQPRASMLSRPVSLE